MLLLSKQLKPYCPRAHAEQNLGSANYILPLCKSLLKVVDKDAEAIKNILRTDPVARLTTVGMCVKPKPVAIDFSS